MKNSKTQTIDRTGIYRFIIDKLPLSVAPVEKMVFDEEFDLLRVFCEGIKEEKYIDDIFFFAEDLGLEKNAVGEIVVGVNSEGKALAFEIFDASDYSKFIL